MSKISKFCPNCGREIEDYCPECQSIDIPIKKKSVWFCKHCYNIKISNKEYWPKSEEERINILLKAIFPEDIALSHYEYSLPKLKVGKRILQLKLYLDSFEVDANYDIEVYVCKKCREKQNEFYEAIVQLRPKSKKMVEIFTEKINSLFSRDEISKVVELKEGYNLYVKSWRRALKVLKLMKQEFGGEIKITRKLHTYDKIKSKRVYKVTLLYRNLDFG